MVCKNCGTTTDNMNEFCPNCGASFNKGNADLRNRSLKTVKYFNDLASAVHGFFIVMSVVMVLGALVADSAEFSIPMIISAVVTYAFGFISVAYIRWTALVLENLSEMNKK